MKSAVSQALIQLAKAEGAKCIVATAGTDEKVKLCESLGATKGINYKTTDWGLEVKKLAPRGVDFIVDFVIGMIRDDVPNLGGGYFERDIEVAANDATIVILAMLGGGYVEKVDGTMILSKRLTVIADEIILIHRSVDQH